MNGLENIEKKIIDEAKEKSELIIKEAQEKAESIKTTYEEKTKWDVITINEKNVLMLQDISIKAKQADQMERRKQISAQKQEIIGDVFKTALDILLSLGDEEYFTLLLKLSKDATGDKLGGELLFNEKDRAKYGQRVVDALNSELIGGKVEAAKNAVTSAVGTILGGDLSNLEEIAVNAKKELGGELITLSKDTAPIDGGVVVRRGKIELNCSISALIRVLSDELAGSVSDKLFPKGA